MMRRLANLGALSAILATLGPTPAQEPPPSSPPTAVYQQTVSVYWVLVPVVVRDRSGYVRKLEKEDFRLFVDDRPLPVESFHAGEDAPVSVHFLQDLSGSMANAGKLDLSRRVLSFFVNTAQSGDEFAVTTFGGGRVEVKVPFTTDRWAVQSHKQTWQPYGVTALHDAVAWLPELTTGSGNAKRVAVLITDGVDNASVIPPGEARRLVRGAELPVYVLGLRTGTPFELDQAGDKRYRYADVLNLLADQTGGRYASLSTPREVTSTCTEILRDLRQQYVLGFRVDELGQGEYHPIRVEVKGRNRTVSHRRGYRGGAPMPAAP